MAGGAKRLSVIIDADVGAFNKSVQGMQAQMKTATGGISKDMGGVGGAVKSAVGTVAGVVASAFAVSKIVDFGKTLITTGAEAQVVENQFALAFAGIEKDGIASLEGLSSKYNILPNRLKPAMASIQSYFKGTGADATTAGAMTEKAMNLAANGAAQYDKSVEDVTGSLKSFLMGNYEAGDAIGINTNKTKIAKKYNEKYGGSFDDLNDAQQGNYLLEYAEDIYTASGAMEAGVNEADDYGNVLGNLKQYWKDFTSELGTALLPLAVEAIKKLGEFIGKIDVQAIIAGFKEFTDTVVKIKDGVVKAGEALGKFLEFFSPIVAGIGAMAVAYGLYALALGIKSGVETIAIASMIAMDVATKALATSTAFLLSPLGMVLIAIGLLVAIGVLLYKNWDTISATAKVVWSALGEFFKETAKRIVDSFKEDWEELKTLFSTTWSAISEGISTAWNAIKEFFSSLWASIVALAISIWTPIAQFFTELWEGVKAVFQFAWDAIKAVLTIALGLIMVLIATVWNTIATTINTILSIIKTIVITVWTTILTVITTVMTAILSVVQPIWEAIKLKVTEVVNTIKEVVTTVWNAIKTTTQTIFNSIKEIATIVWNAINLTISTIVNAIKNTISNIFNAIYSVVSTIFNTIKTIATTIWNSILTTISIIVNTIKNTITSIFNSIKNTITTIFNAIKSVANAVWNGIKSTIVSVASGISGSVSSTFNSLKSTVSGIWNGIKSSITTPIESAKNSVRNAINAMKGFFNFSWKLPRISMPSFSVSGSANPLDWIKQGVPKLGVSWHAKGGIATGASVIGVGEKGDEAIVPLSQKHRMKPFAQAISDMMPSQENSNAGVLREQVSLIIPIVVDGKEIARAVVEDLDTALYTQRRKTARAKGRL